MAGHTIFLVRHAAAEARGSAWPDDRRRPLTAEGRDAFARLVARVAPVVRPALILTSGLTRAWDTARVLAAARRSTVPVRRSRTLEPGRPPGRVLARLRRDDVPPVVALVGHEPDLSTLATYLTGASPSRPFRKGAIWRLEMRTVEAGGGRVSRVHTPVRLRRKRRR